MDTELARTFLAVIATGSFVKCAERLHVTQSTVSARIRSLEAHLGCSLFVRNKAGTTLTPGGRRFQRHASVLMRTLEQARQDVGLPAGFDAVLTIGARIGLWEGLLTCWFTAFARQAPAVSVRAEIGFEDDLMLGLIEGRLDLGLMYTPQSRPGMRVEKLFEEELVLVTTAADAPPEPGAGYVYVDWGPEFRARHALNFPDYEGPALAVNIGWLGLRHILDGGGSGYFPQRLVAALLASGALHRPRGAPVFALPAYAVTADEADDGPVALALDSLRRVLPQSD